MSQNAPQFNQAQLDQMRAILAQHDSQSTGVVKEFDLNNPPAVRYTHQEYPKFLYHHEKRAEKIVHSRDQEDGFLKLGYDVKPFPAELPQVERDADDSAEVAALKAEIEALKKKKPANK